MAEEGDELERAAGPPRRVKPVRRAFLTGAKPAIRKGAASAPVAEVRRDKRRRRWRITEAGVALAALMLSGSAFLIGGIQYVRGSDISVLAPEQIYIYRDAGPRSAQAWLAVPISVVNAASPDYGDVVLRVSLGIGPNAQSIVWFQSDAVMSPVPVPDQNPDEMRRAVARGVERCPDGARCLPELGFYVVQRPRQLLDVPGASSKSEHLSFLLSPDNCTGDPRACAAFESDSSALEFIARLRQPTITVQLEMNSDGHKHVVCRLELSPRAREGLPAYFRRTGWVAPACATL